MNERCKVFHVLEISICADKFKVFAFGKDATASEFKNFFEGNTSVNRCPSAIRDSDNASQLGVDI